MRDLVSAAKLETWMSEGWQSFAYSVYTRILQRAIDSAGENVTVNSLQTGTAHSKIHQIGVISLEEGTGAVAVTPSGYCGVAY